MKKILTTILVVSVLGVGAFFGYEYVTEPKIVDGVMSKKIDGKGRPIEIAKTFEPDDTIYFSGKQNRFWIRKAKVIWYKGEIIKENRLYVKEEVIVNKGKYFTAKLTIPKDIEEGHYGVTMYVKGSKIMETKAEFDVKK